MFPIFGFYTFHRNKNKALSLTKALAISNGVGKINFGSNPKFPQTCQMAIKIVMLIKCEVKNSSLPDFLTDKN